MNHISWTTDNRCSSEIGTKNTSYFLFSQINYFFGKFLPIAFASKGSSFAFHLLRKTVPRKKKFFQEKWKKNHFTITIKYCIRAKKCSNIYDKYCFIIFLRTSKAMAYSIL